MQTSISLFTPLTHLLFRFTHSNQVVPLAASVSTAFCVNALMVHASKVCTFELVAFHNSPTGRRGRTGHGAHAATCLTHGFDCLVQMFATQCYRRTVRRARTRAHHE
jgi:hypothetical protein